MDNTKMGEIIRETRKKKGLTQKDIATHLHITDRAVSKWERGICAPDLALLEPLSEILEISIAELITGEVDVADENKEKVELVVKETIEYSKQETTTKNKKNRVKFFFIIIAAILLLLSLISFMLHNGFFHKVGTYPSPDGSTIVTVYNCHLQRNGFPTNEGFTVDIKGKWTGRHYYTSCSFKGTWWSPDGNYQVISMYDHNNKTYLVLDDYIDNAGCNLNAYLEMALYDNGFFSEVPLGDDGFLDINFEFLQWSEKDPSVMLIYFNYNDANGKFHDGYVWYDWETLQISGEMELKQDK